MRQVLVDHSRKRNAAKRGGDWERGSLDVLLDNFETILPVESVAAQAGTPLWGTFTVVTRSAAVVDSAGTIAAMTHTKRWDIFLTCQRNQWSVRCLCGGLSPRPPGGFLLPVDRREMREFTSLACVIFAAVAHS